MPSPRKPLTPQARHARAVLAQLTSAHGSDHELTRSARTAFETEQAISRVVSGLAGLDTFAHELTDEQRFRLCQALESALARARTL